MTSLRKLAASALGALVLFTATVLGGCSDDGGGGSTGAALVGNWQPGDGDLFSFLPGADLLVLQLRDDSSGVIVFQEPESKALGCVDLIYTQLSGQTVFIDIETFNEFSAFFTRSFTFDVEAGALTLNDSVGRSQTFTKLGEAPAGSQCQRFSGVASITETDDDLAGGTGLVFDGSLLWFGADGPSADLLVSTDPATGAAGLSVNLPSNISKVQAYDGTRLWFVKSPDHIASRRDFADAEVDTIDTIVDLSHELSIDSMAWDGTHLWMTGRGAASNENELLQVNIGTKSLVSQQEFALELSAFTWDGASFWGLVDGSPSPIIEIDPSTFQVTRTYEIPGHSILFNRYEGIAAVGGNLYILAQERSGEQVVTSILRVTP